MLFLDHHFKGLRAIPSLPPSWNAFLRCPRGSPLLSLKVSAQGNEAFSENPVTNGKFIFQYPLHTEFLSSFLIFSLALIIIISLPRFYLFTFFTCLSPLGIRLHESRGLDVFHSVLHPQCLEQNLAHNRNSMNIYKCLLCSQMIK